LGTEIAHEFIYAVGFQTQRPGLELTCGRVACPSATLG
jgi:hypothetical protein